MQLEAKIEMQNIHGLSSEEAAAKIKQFGFNELPTTARHNIFVYLLDVFREPIFLLLLIGALTYFVIGSRDEGLMLLSFVLIIAGITCYQEAKSERALEALKRLSSPRAFVIRDGIGKRIAGREVVVGDVIVISEGDCIPADARLLDCDNLQVDESILTGEALPVIKNLALTAPATDEVGCDRLSLVYSGTYVVQGKCIAQVIATGAATEIGKIGKQLATIASERTLLQKNTDILVRNFAIWGFALCVVIAIIYGSMHADWINGFLVGIALAMAILPEELPVILTIFLAIGAWRISLQKVLTRHVPAIETLGAATVLCVDKTGTITQNSMSVAEIFALTNSLNVTTLQASDVFPETFHQLIEYSILASQRDPFDPMEKAIKKFGEHYLQHTEHLHNDWQLVRQYPLSKELLAISLVWQSRKSHDYVVAAKGAPEAIFDLCHLSQEKSNEYLAKIHAMANAGLRVLGVAKANFKNPTLPHEQHDFNFEFLGLIGLADPVRPAVAAALQKCYTAGVRVVMLTGDYAGTAQNIARQIGLQDAENVVTGSELAALSDAELAQKIKTVNIFARIMPEQKLRLVNALKANHEIVAMTGDGVNDAPALKAAHIGVAMGARGTDVAREAADLVLLDDDFSSIVSAIRLGRRIFDNIKKAISYTIAVHIPIIGMTLIPVLLKWPLILLPIHIVILELIIDPTCSIVFEAEQEEANSMQRPPRNSHEPLLNSQMVGVSLFQGISVLMIVLASVLLGRFLRFDPNQVRVVAFVALVVTNLTLILANLSWTSSLLQILRRKNIALWGVLSGALLVIILVLNIPWLHNLFYFKALPQGGLWVVASIVMVSVLWLGVMRKFRRFLWKCAIL